ncbi:MAG: LutB/LldF family L-lactate oxidation iron-sulfur protein [Phycisphaerae bacterium]|jgi:L-lactate dehydrogenase complex protein LldF
MSRRDEFRERVRRAVADRRVVDAVHLATWRKVEAREQSLAALRDAQGLRELAGRIKQHTLDHLPQYLDQFVGKLGERGVPVYLATDAAAAREVICRLAREHDCRLTVKVKSMTTEEVGLNDALASEGVAVHETDLGEFIVQIDHDRPSHIVTPIIHKDRRQVARAMERELGCPYTEDPTELTKLARGYLRDIFRRCDLGISGANFGVAETGTICICTNEGNGRMTTTRPRLHVVLMGIEKLVPRLADLAVLLKLLSRSSTGQPLGSYTTLITGPRQAGDADGPEHLHVVLLDNGRSSVLGGAFHEVLRCVRCGACLNACPVYRNIGGHAYNSVYPGPIGSLVTPLLNAAGGHDALPRASSLCGACAEACPVKIDIPAYLIQLRAAARDRQPWAKRAAFRGWLWAMSSEWTYAWGQRLMATFLPDDGEDWAVRGFGPLGEWTSNRDLRRPPGKPFRKLWNEGLCDER